MNRRKPEGWLAPSVQHKVDSHLKLIDRLHRLLPIRQLTIEVAQFDIQKIKNPLIQETEYQQGNQLGFWNVREYVLWRDNHTCQHCKGKSKDKILNVHHRESRKGGCRQKNTAPKWVHGFQLFDKVCFEGQECFIFGRRSSGYFDVRKLDGTRIHASASYKKLQVVERATTLLIERRQGEFLPAL